MSNVAESYAGAPAQGGRGGRAQMTPEQQAAMRKAAEETKQWRLSVSMDKYKAFRKLYQDAGDPRAAVPRQHHSHLTAKRPDQGAVRICPAAEQRERSCCGRRPAAKL